MLAEVVMAEWRLLLYGATMWVLGLTGALVITEYPFRRKKK